MRIPDSVKIGPKVFRVERPEYVTDGGDNLWGQCDHTEGAIRVTSRLAQDQAEVTFAHEVIHALDIQYALGLKESQVKRLAYGFMAFLKDNGFLE